MYYYTVCYFTGIFYAVIRQICMLLIDTKGFVLCILWLLLSKKTWPRWSVCLTKEDQWIPENEIKVWIFQWEACTVSSVATWVCGSVAPGQCPTSWPSNRASGAFTYYFFHQGRSERVWNITTGDKTLFTSMPQKQAADNCLAFPRWERTCEIQEIMKHF